MEKLSKHKVESPFTVFMRNETEKLSECLTVITSDLQVGTSIYMYITYYTDCIMITYLCMQL